MKDIQSLADDRRIDIQKVGVKTISYPITLQDKAQVSQHTVASVNMYVNLPHHFKGTHMSRFIEILNDFHGKIDLKNFRQILDRMKERLEAEAAHLEMVFPFFLAFETGNGVLDTRSYTCRMHGSLEDTEELLLELEIPLRRHVNTGDDRRVKGELEYGNVKIAVKFNHFIWIEDLIVLVEQSMEDGVNGTALPNTSITPERMNQLVGDKLREESAVKWFAVTTEKKTNGYTSFATTEI